MTNCQKKKHLTIANKFAGECNDRSELYIVIVDRPFIKLPRLISKLQIKKIIKKISTPIEEP